MTALDHKPPATLPEVTYQILRRYVAGENLDQIVKETGQTTDHVQHVIQHTANLNRQRAAELVRQHETWRRNAQLRAVPTPAAGDEPQPERIDTIADLLDAAERTEVPVLMRSAEKIRRQVAALQAGVTEHHRQAHLREEQAQLKARLAEIAAQLRGDTPTATTAATTAPASPAANPKAVRAWAAEHGINVPPVGRVPRAVVDQYLAATTETTGSS